MTEIRGVCSDCLFLRQEWTVVETPNGQLKRVVDVYCGICSIFKRLDGYCDMWEEK